MNEARFLVTFRELHESVCFIEAAIKIHLRHHLVNLPNLVLIREQHLHRGSRLALGKRFGF
jgi:hypothetical protein